MSLFWLYVCLKFAVANFDRGWKLDVGGKNIDKHLKQTKTNNLHPATNNKNCETIFIMSF